MASCTFGIFAKFAVQALHGAGHFPGMSQQGQPRRGGLYAAFAAFEQSGAKAPFDVRNAFADSGRRHESTLAGAGDGAFLANDDEQVQGQVIKGLHCMARHGEVEGRCTVAKLGLHPRAGSRGPAPIPNSGGTVPTINDVSKALI